MIKSGSLQTGHFIGFLGWGLALGRLVGMGKRHRATGDDDAKRNLCNVSTALRAFLASVIVRFQDTRRTAFRKTDY
jgi:hypothetical protein